MTTRKTREAKVRATEEVVFGYRPPSATKRMNNGDVEAPDDLITDDDALDGEPTYAEACVKITVGELKKAIREALKQPNPKA